MKKLYISMIVLIVVVWAWAAMGQMVNKTIQFAADPPINIPETHTLKKLNLYHRTVGTWVIGENIFHMANWVDPTKTISFSIRRDFESGATHFFTATATYETGSGVTLEYHESGFSNEVSQYIPYPPPPPPDNLRSQ